MKNWMHTPGWQFEIAQEQALRLEPQAHVKAYWRQKFAQAAALGDAKITRQPEFNPRGCYNGIANWYERGYVSPTEARYPSFKEDPTAYALAGD